MATIELDPVDMDMAAAAVGKAHLAVEQHLRKMLEQDKQIQLLQQHVQQITQEWAPSDAEGLKRRIKDLQERLAAIVAAEPPPAPPAPPGAPSVPDAEPSAEERVALAPPLEPPADTPPTPIRRKAKS